MNYQIIVDEKALDQFIEFLPDNLSTEVYYICLFGRHKYDPQFPNSKDSGQLSRVVARKSEIKEKLRRMEVPIGSYSRDGVVASQQSLAAYIGLNPRNLIKANKNLMVTLVNRIADGDMEFNPISAATTEIHRAVGRKFFVDFDYDNIEVTQYLSEFERILPCNTYSVLKTRGGFHLIVDLEKIKGVKTNWHKELSALPGCDVKGADNLTPVPGCTQGGFVPYFVESKNV